MSLRVSKERKASLLYRAAVSDAIQYVLELASFGDVVEDVISDH